MFCLLQYILLLRGLFSFIVLFPEQGEGQKKLNLLSNEVFIKALGSSSRTCILVSEEDEEATFVEPSKCGKLMYGGIFLYPADKKNPNGKLRVLYEVFLMSFLTEQVGGQAFTGKQRTLDLVPTKIHERSPIFLGIYDDVDEIKELYAAEEKKE